MSFTHGSFTFTQLRGPLVVGPFDLDLQIGQFPGVNRESHLVGGVHGSEIHCSYTFSNYSSETNLEVALREVRQQIGVTADIVIDSRTYPDCTFLGFVEQPNARFRDGSGEHDWVTTGILRWRFAGIV